MLRLSNALLPFDASRVLRKDAATLRLPLAHRMALAWRARDKFARLLAFGEPLAHAKAPPADERDDLKAAAQAIARA